MTQDLFTTSLYSRLSRLLESVVPADVDIYPDVLIQAYATVRYTQIPSSERPASAPYPYFAMDTCSDDYASFVPVISRFNVASLILSAVPSFVGDPLLLVRYLDEVPPSFAFDVSAGGSRIREYRSAVDSALLETSLAFGIHEIRRIHRDILDMRKSDEDDDGDETAKAEKIADAIYRQYQLNAGKVSLPYFSRRTFDLYLEPICIIRQTNPRTLIGNKAGRNAYAMIKMMYNTLSLSQAEVLDFLISSILDKEWEENIKGNRFVGGEGISSDVNKKKLNDLYCLLSGAGSDPASLLAGLELYKKNEFQWKAADKSRITRQYRNTDAALEMSVAMRLLASEVVGRPGDAILVILPSPTFILSLAAEKVFEGHQVTFVMSGESAARIMELHFSPDNFYASVARPEFAFIGFAEWADGLGRIGQLEESLIMVFENRYESLKGKTRITKKEQEDLARENRNVAELICTKAKAGTVMFGLSPDAAFYDPQYMSGTLVGNRKNGKLFFSDAYVIPKRMLSEKADNAGSTPMKKIFWKARQVFGTDGEISKVQYLKRTAGLLPTPIPGADNRMMINAFIPDEKKFYNVDMGQLCTYSESLRSFITGRPRKMKSKLDPVRVCYTPEISIYYTKRKHCRNGLFEGYKIEAFVLEFKDDDLLDATGDKIMDSIKEWLYSIASTEKYIEQRLLMQYPKAEAEVRCPKYGEETVSENNTRVIRSVIARNYLKSLEGRQLSLGTYIYIHPELDPGFEYKEGKKVVRLYLNDILKPIMALQIAILTVDDYTMAIKETCPGMTQSFTSEVIRTLYRLLESARKDGQCKVNVVAQLLSDEIRLEKFMAAFRQAYIKKVLSRDEFLRVCKAVSDHLEDEPAYIGVMIKLATGLNSHIISALKWEDHKGCRSYGFYQLHVYRQVSGDGKTFLTLVSDDDIRIIPCMPMLQAALAAVRTRRLSQFIVPSNTAPTGEGREDQPIKPWVIDHMVQTVMAEAGIKGTVIELASDDGSGMEIDMGKSRTDVLHENIRFRMINNGFNQDEVAYIIGNRRPTTAGNYYIDFGNDTTQYKLYTKLCRIDNEILGRRGAPVSREDLAMESGCAVFDSKDCNHAVLEVEVKSRKGHDVSFEVVCEHGFRLQVPDGISVDEEFCIRGK